MTSFVRPVPIGSPRGLTKSQATRSAWRRTGRGLYVPASVDRSEPAQRIVEAVTALPGGVLTGWAVLHLAGVPYVDGRDRRLRPLPVQVIVPDKARARPGVRLSRERMTCGVRRLCGLPCASPMRATVDAMREPGDFREAVVVLDQVLRHGLVDRAELVRFARTLSRWRGLDAVRRALPLAESRSASPGETRLRLIWELDAGLPRPLCNRPLFSEDRSRFLGIPDLLDPSAGVVGEYDGSPHRDRATHRRDAQRDAAFKGVGLETFAAVGADVSRVERLVGRIRSAYARSGARPASWTLEIPNWYYELGFADLGTRGP